MKFVKVSESDTGFCVSQSVIMFSKTLWHYDVTNPLMALIPGDDHAKFDALTCSSFGGVETHTHTHTHTHTLTHSHTQRERERERELCFVMGAKATLPTFHRLLNTPGKQ